MCIRVDVFLDNIQYVFTRIYICEWNFSTPVLIIVLCFKMLIMATNSYIFAEAKLN